MNIALNRQSKLSLAALASVLALISSPADAALLEGKTIRANMRYRPTPTSGTQGPEQEAVVGPGVEFPGFGFQTVPTPLPAFVAIDVSDKQVQITLLNDQRAADQEAIFLTDPDFSTNITSYTLNPATNWAGFIPLRVQGSGSQISFNFTDLFGLAGQKVVLDLVPEPATAGLALIGAAAGVAARRRRRQALAACRALTIHAVPSVRGR